MRKPSATLVVAAAALVMATIGTSVAATGYTITSSRQIKPGSISLESLSRSARTALRGQRGPAGLPGADGSDGADGNDGLDGQDGQDGQNATDLWAQVRADGSINASSSGVTATQSASAGVYYVNFGADITHCAVIAVQASIPGFSTAGQAIAGIPGPAFVATASAGATLAAGFPSASSATVQTRRTNGNPASTSFSVAALC
jgi:hypothetical protein